MMLIRISPKGVARRNWYILAVLTAAIITLSACTKEEETQVKQIVRPVKMLKVVSGADVLERTYPGRVRAANRVDLAFQVGGPLIDLAVDEGQEVDRGAVLARIDPRDFEVNLRNAEGKLSNAQATLRSAQSEYDRILRIRNTDPGAASESMVVKRREAVDRASADIASLQATVDSNKNSLNDTKLRAPFAGVVSKRYVDNFQEVRPKEPILSLDDNSHLELVVDIPEILMAQIRSNQPSEIFAEFSAAPDKRYKLTLKEYATRADSATQTYQVVLEMKSPDELNILPGMTAMVSGTPASLETESNKFSVPAYAVFADDTGKPNVWILDTSAMTVHLRSVTTGEVIGQESIEILEGLQSGETIVVTGVTRLQEGMKVRDLSEIEGYDK